MTGEGYADVWVVVRCFNEAPIVGAVVADLRREFRNVVGVDDGSDDDSAHLMAVAGARVVRHAVNLGPGAALETGLKFALLDLNAQHFVCFDADGQHQVADAVAMVERVRREPVDILLGSRFLGAASGITRGRRAVLRAARLFERLNSGMNLTDAHNGLRVFSRQFAEQVELSLSGMAYASELLSLVRRTGSSFAEHPVQVAYSDYSRSKGQRSINSINIATDVWLAQVLGGRR